MIPIRVIPCLLLKGRGFVKTVRFKNPSYLGDPLNILKIFNEKEVDELVVLDITATVERRPPRFELIREIVSEAFMPVAYGGGIRTLEDARQVMALGVEKIILNTAAAETPNLVGQLAGTLGSQSVLVSIDVGRSMFGRREIRIRSGRKRIPDGVVDYARRMESLGSGEILLTAIDRDGTFDGYDLNLITSVTQSVRIPVIASGGAAGNDDFRRAVKEAGAAAVAAGSAFVFQGRNRAVLINYPEPSVLKALFT